ncbi:MAG: AP endonuclease [Ruminococcaceae bacterium]|nr:AP endonuclease [Oscillospiraceae bacterium]
MIQTMNYPISKYCIDQLGGWETLRKQVYALGLDGVEAIADPDDLDDRFPDDLAAGFHMVFYPDWLDFWRQDEKRLLRKFGSWEMVDKIYRGTKPEQLLKQFQDDLALGQRLKTPYMVFHVSDVSLEEGYTYRWEHTNREVLDGAVEFINHLLWHVEPTFDFLVENQWWPGFTFTDPAETEYLLSRIEYPRVGIMLDTGHLMNANTKITTQSDGIAWILTNLRKHGELAKRVYGLHFHQSVSGAYVRKNTGRVPETFNGEYFHDFSVSYPHIQSIDRHLPWTNPDCVKILDAVQPKYLTHELSGRHNQLAAVKRQLGTIRKGYKCK